MDGEKKTGDGAQVELSKEHKKALCNFRDQVRYKDYKGLIRTLEALEPIVSSSEAYFVPEKYQSKYRAVHENILLLKNIVISDIKYSVVSEKALDKAVIVLSTLLSEKYACDVKGSVVVWISNTALGKHAGKLRQIKKLSDLGEALRNLLEVRDEVCVGTAHLPIWWNISRVIISDLSVVVKNRLVELISTGEFTEEEYLASLGMAIDFERTYLQGTARSRSPSGASPGGSKTSQLPTSSPASHLKLLEDLSIEHPIYVYEGDRNILSQAYVPAIDIYIKSELKDVASAKLHFCRGAVPEDVYKVFFILTGTLSKLLYFSLPMVSISFLRLADELVAKCIRESTYDVTASGIVSVVETVDYVEETSLQMLRRIEQLSGCSDLKAPRIEGSLADLENRAYASLASSLSRRIRKIDLCALSKGISHSGSRLERAKEQLDELKEEVVRDIAQIVEMESSRKEEALDEWLSTFGQALFNSLARAKISVGLAQQILCTISDIEAGVRAIAKGVRPEGRPARSTIIDVTKLYLKLFLVHPSAARQFVVNFSAISNGLFTFHQILEKVSHKYHRLLIEEFNRRPVSTAQL